MARISANALFHFTDKPEKLASILTNDFWPHYHKEKIHLRKDVNYELLIPMVSFCDIPLSQIDQHVETYGHYGIGMSKEWGMGKGLNPILYLNAGSILAGDLHTAFKATFEKEGVEALVKSQRFIKEYRDGDKCYYDEREWRFVPDGEIFQMAPKPKKLAELNERAQSHRLSFTPTDIRYIVTKHRAEVPALIEDIFRLKGNRSREEQLLVISKIISCEDIFEDF